MVGKVSLHVTPKSLECCSLVHKLFLDKAISPPQHPLLLENHPELVSGLTQTCSWISVVYWSLM